MTSVHHSLPSERKFGLLLAATLYGLSAYSYYRNLQPLEIAAYFATGCLLSLVSILIPRVLAPFNKAWFLLGQTMGKLVSPVVLCIIFFFLITPVAVLGRLFGRDVLKLKRPPLKSYWVERSPPGPDSDSFKRQF